MNQTLNYYAENAVDFAAGTVNVDFSATQERFLAKLSAGAFILDFGCGSGRDKKTVFPILTDELIASKSQHYAHLYRTGILGILAFAGCGVHVPCLACVFFYKYMAAASPETAVDASVRFGLFFLLPGTILFFIFWLIHHFAHIAAFSKCMTPYPKWCWIFCPAVGMALTMLLKFFPETPLRNALTAAWISIGNLWMFGGLLVMMKKADR